MPYMGLLGAAGVGLEPSWGASVAAARYLEVTQADVRPVIGREIPAMVAATRARRRRRDGQVVYRGPVVFDATADNVGEILLAAFGTVTTTLINTVGANVYRHFFTRVESTGLPSLTLEQNMGGLWSRQVLGARVEELALAVQPGGSLVFDVEFRARDEASIAPTNPSYSTLESLHHNGFTAEVNSAASGDVESAEVRFGNNLVDDIFGAGQEGKLSHLPAGLFQVSGRYTMAFESGQAHEALKTGIYQALGFSFAGATITGAWRYGLSVELPRVSYRAAEAPLSPDRLVYDISFDALFKASEGKDARVALTNVTSGYGA